MERFLESRSHNQFAEMEPRAETAEDVIRISGYGVVWNRFYTVWGFKERIAPTAADKTLRENPDIRGMFNHDPSFLLGRTKSGTMDVSTDDKGLPYEIRADAQDPQAQSVARKIARRDVDGSSVAMFVHKEEWLDQKGKPSQRTILELELIETGPVTMPASPSTTAKIQRAMQDTGIDYDAINGLVVKQRAGFDLSHAEADQIDRTIEFLTRLKSEPDRIADHSGGTAPKVDQLSAYSAAALTHRNRVVAALAL